MKKVFLSILLMATGFFAQAQTTNAFPYCAEFFDLQYNSINTLTIGANAPISFGPAGSSANQNNYLYYNNLTAPVIPVGTNVNLGLNFYNAPDAEPMYFAVYIDFDQSATFDWPNEMVMNNIICNSGSLPCLSTGNLTVNQNVNIPSSAVGGLTRMRIIRTSDIVGITPYIFDPLNDFIFECNTAGAWPNFIVGCAYDVDINIAVPTVTATPALLVPFSAVVGTPSANQTYTVSGSGLQGNLTIAAPAQFEISTLAASGFTNSLTLTPTAGAVPNTTIYVRFNPAAAGFYSGNISNASINAPTIFVGVSGNATAPIIPTLTTSTTTLTPFTAFVGYPSAPQTYNLNGVYLSGNVNVSAPAEFEISTTAASGYGSSLVFTPVSGTLASTTIYVRYNPGAVGSHSGNVTNWSASSNVIDIPVSGVASVAPAPSMTVTPSSLLTFNTIVGNPSPTQTVSVAGTYLLGNIDLTVPLPFEISLAVASGYGQTLTLPSIGGFVNATTVYIRFNPNIPNTYNGNLTITCPNITTVVIPLTGVGVPNTPITSLAPAAFSYFLTTFGIPSANQTMQVSGNYLVSPLAISAPQHFQISTQTASGFGSFVYLQPDSTGKVNNTVIYLRYNPLTPGNHQGYLNVTSMGAIDKTRQLNGYATPTGIDDLTEDLSVIYPTKTNDIVNVKDAFKGSQILLYDFAGRKVMDLKKVESNFSIKHLSNGIYLLQVVQNGKHFSGKIIKE